MLEAPASNGSLFGDGMYQLIAASRALRELFGDLAGDSPVVRAVGGVLVGASLILLLALPVWAVAQLSAISSFDQFLHDVVRPIYWDLRVAMLYWVSPFVLVAVPVILVLSAAVPADQSQPVFSRGLLQDVVWSFVTKYFSAILLTAYTAYLSAVFDGFFGWMVVDAALGWPAHWRAVLGFVLADFLGWVRHVVMHKVPAFWHFHAVHHSQLQMNPFTIDRVHPMEFLISLNIRFIPMFALQNSLDVVLAFYLVHRIHDAFNHSNIRLNLGPLRYVFVTPQSHRIHHSSDPRHYDSNYGAILSIWDHLFGTQHRKFDEYPSTGIPDSTFPLETAGRMAPGSVLVGQLLYPFRKLLPASKRSRTEPAA